MSDPVPVPRPSETPLPCPFCGTAGRLQRRNFSDRFHSGGHDWLVVCPGNGCCSHSGKTEREAIEVWNRRSPSVPTATQEQRDAGVADATPTDYVKINAAIHSIMEFSHSEVLRTWEWRGLGKVDGKTSIQQMRVELVREALGPVSSSEEAANSDTDRLDWLEANGGFSHDDVDRGMSMSQWGRNWDKITLREAIDKAKLAARVQGENSQ